MIFIHCYYLRSSLMSTKTIFTYYYIDGRVPFFAKTRITLLSRSVLKEGGLTRKKEIDYLKKILYLVIPLTV